MRNGFKAEHFNDEKGRPAGGSTIGTGFAISWQNGPLGRHTSKCDLSRPGIGCSPGCTRVKPNGAFVEDVIAAAVDRIEYYQGSGFACEENAEALEHLKKALEALDRRTKAREARGVEGTHVR